MEVLVYADSHDGAKERLLGEISRKTATDPLLVLDHESFERELRCRMRFQQIIVYLASLHRDLTLILSIREIMIDTSLILILPDRNPDTVRKGLSLYPRYQTFSDGDFKDVAAVLEKMLKRRTFS
ncbi:MAG: hypothetical protein GY846_11610 [Deltaproteobacteria bacterium]|nr:hypothetical protein [Deltaproteobacteria bacterium]